MISIRPGPSDNIIDVIRRSPVAQVAGAEDVMKQCLYRSIEVRHGLQDGKVACVWGLIPPTLLSDTAYIWLLTTDIVAENKFLFIRYSQRYVEEALKIWPRLTGDVVAGNHAAKRWLRWLGAEFSTEVDGKWPFVIRRKSNG